MKQLGEVINRSPLLSFFVLAFLFTWSLLPFAAASIPISLVALCGPAAAAVVVSLAGGSERWTEFRGRLTDWRVELRWYLLAVLLPVLISGLRSVIEYALGAHGPIEPQPINVLGIVVFILVLGEEAGWRGFALPQLLPRLGRWWTSLIIGVAWALWHLPLFYMPSMPQFGSPFAAFVIYTVALSVILTFLATRTRASIVIATLFHGAVNTFGLVNTAAEQPLRGWTNAASYGLLALAITAAWGYSYFKTVKKVMKQLLLTLLICVCCIHLTAQNKPPLLPEPVIAALANELSGETAKRNLEFVSRQHRMRASKGFRTAAEFIAEQARGYGLEGVEILKFPADGKTFYGTQKARPAWDAEFAELWELGATPIRIASWDAMPLVLAQDSESGNVTAELVEVGAGTSERDYAGKDVRGKLVLASSQPEGVARLAVEKYGAVGILSYAQNQRTAWFGENDNLIRWGHLSSFTETKTFAFMLSLKQARGYQTRLARGEKITFKAEVRAGKHTGNYDIVTATIPGSDPKLKDEEIAFSCHLDHPRPGANDNASGCVTILEVGRTLVKLIKEGKIARPARTIRFIWPPEIEGTLVLLNARPDITRRIKAAIHMDMVGGGPETKAVFHVTRGPASLPSFVNDVAEAFGEFVNEQSYQYAARGTAAYPLVAPEGGKEPLNARLADFSMGSDHQIYTDSSFGIPAIYLNDWPDRYIHTNYDTPAMIDPTKLKRAGFIGAASGYFLANGSANDAETIWGVIKSRGLLRSVAILNRQTGLDAAEAANLARFHLWHESSVFNSLEKFINIPFSFRSSREAVQFWQSQQRLVGETVKTTESIAATADARLVFRRNPEIKGTMGAFGYDYFTDKYGEEKAAAIRLLRFQTPRGSGCEFAYEVLNLADGKRNVQEIRDAVSAIYGPVPIEIVLEYLRALETIKVVQVVNV